MNISYIGEHLWLGKLGQFMVILSFTAALLSGLSYFFSARSNDIEVKWKKIARISFGFHSFSVISIFGILFYLIYSHYFEYYYVWHHSSTVLPMRYMFACFWEGQEGSFLLWEFWHVVLAWFIIKKAGEWESPVMSVVALVQIFLSSMLLGIYVLGYKVGSDPFILLRNHPDMANLPFIQMPDYLSKIADGRGLNPLLQNYWMVIHPPTLFLGFASTLIPFAYAIAGLWKNKTTEWIKPAISWAFFGVMILGTGILMGAAWAYESLSFGGFWAWDPVENASLVPWLTFVGAAHLMVVNQKRKSSAFSVLFFTILTFLLILYSTFLTRSGILGNSSVHAFTDLGMSGQLLVYMGVFVVLAIGLIIRKWKLIPKDEQEESLTSREFWMFIGALILLLSSLQITFTTSLPVINKLFHTNYAPPSNIKEHYNKWQLPVAVMISILIAFAQFLKYKSSPAKDFFKRMMPAAVGSVILTCITVYILALYNAHYIALTWAGWFAVIGNADYMGRVLKGKVKNGGASIAHIGFGLIMLGVLISNSKSEVISQNHTNVDLGKELSSNENVLLTKSDTVAMGSYYISYRGKRHEGVNYYYEIEYYKPDEHGKLKKDFSLFPIIQTNPKMGNVSEPDTRHFASKDIYTHVTYAEIEDPKDEDTSLYKPAVLKSAKIGDTLFTNNCLIYVKELDKNVDKQPLGLSSEDIAVKVNLEIVDINKKTYKVSPVFIIRNNTIFSTEEKLEDLGIKVSFVKIDPSSGKINLSITEKKSNSKEFIVMKAIVFPYINLLWMGAILMIAGTFLAIGHRLRKN